MLERTTASWRCVQASVLIACLVSSAQADNLYVRATGADSNNGRSATYAVRTIAKAVEIARSGDVIYVGAGVYAESCLINSKTSATSQGWLVIYGDQDGRYTGDAGEVVVRPPDSRWAFDIRQSNNVVLYGLTIDPTGTANRLGVRILDCPATYVVACKLNRCHYGIHATRSNLIVYQNIHQENRHAVYAANATSLQVLLSRFTDTRYSVVTQSVGLVTVNGSQFEWIDSADPVRGIHCVDSGMVVQNSQFTKNNICIYGTGITSAQIDRCQFRQAISHGIHVTGTRLAASNCTIDSAQQALMMDASDQAVPLQNVVIEGANIGVVAQGSDYHFANVSMSNCRIALHQSNDCSRLTIGEDETVVFRGNEYAIYSNTLGAVSLTNANPCSLHVTKCDFQNNDRGLLVYGTTTWLRDCQFAGSAYGVTAMSSDTLEIESSNFRGNEAQPADCSHGVYSDARNVSIRQSWFANSRHGLLLQNPVADQVHLQQNVFEDIEYAAIDLRGGSFVFDGSEGNLIRRSLRGIVGQGTTWTVRTASFDNTTAYPLLDYSGQLTVESLQAQGGNVGVYSANSQRLDLHSTSLQSYVHYAVVVHGCQQTSLSDLVASQNQNGVYVDSVDDRTIQLTRCEAVGNAGYGFVLKNITPSVDSQFCTAKDNLYGIVVEDCDLGMAADQHWLIAGNSYGIVYRRGSITLQGLHLEENRVGLHGYDCDVAASDLAIDAADSSMVVYARERVSIVDSRFQDSRVGIHLTTTALPCDVTIRNCAVERTQGHGVYLRDDQEVGLTVSLDGLTIDQGHQGITLVNCDATISTTHLSNLAQNAIYQLGGSGRINRCLINDVTSGWGLVARGLRSDVDATQMIRAANGVLFESNSGRIRNTTITAANYGIYVAGSESNCSVDFVSIANAASIGFVRRDGNAALSNTIIHGQRYGIYDTATSGVLTHDHNLIDAQIPFVGTDAAENEGTGSPRFVDVDAGDLHLASGSPAINAGIDRNTWVDLDGNERPSFDGFEIGAYEYMRPDGSIKVLSWDEVATQ